MAEYHEQDMYAKERYETMSTGSFRPQVSEKNCYKITKKDARGKPFSFNVYGSGISGSQIRHAVGGEYTRFIVGTKDEELFYKVCVATGENRDGPLTLFFNSHDEYESTF